MDRNRQLLERFDGVTIKHYPFSGSDINKKRVSSILEQKTKICGPENGLGLWKLNLKTPSVGALLFWLNKLRCTVFDSGFA